MAEPMINLDDDFKKDFEAAMKELIAQLATTIKLISNMHILPKKWITILHNKLVTISDEADKIAEFPKKCSNHSM